jgi:hypothetical protein
MCHHLINNNAWKTTLNISKGLREGPPLSRHLKICRRNNSPREYVLHGLKYQKQAK